MLLFVRKHWRWFGVSLALGLALRLYFIFRYPLFMGDSLVYGDIAANWVRHGIYGFSELGEIRPTLVRLPGYPGFLALCFKLFGVEHYHAVMFVQAGADLVTAFVLAATAWEVLPASGLRGRATLTAFAVYCLFPYTANFVATPLSETMTLFALSWALLFAVRGVKRGKTADWIGCGIACAWAVVLRPDGGLVLISIFGYLGWRWWRGRRGDSEHRVSVRDRAGARWVGEDADPPGQGLRMVSCTRGLLRPVLILGGCTVLALAPWTVRNYRTFRVVQPLAPGNATDPGEFYDRGFADWVGTWLAEFISVEEIGWSVPGDGVDASRLPARAFDSAAQREQTFALFAEYNKDFVLTPEMDAQFEQLARERKRAHPWRQYVELPVRRVADMWLRPRTGMLPLDIYWWNYEDHPAETIFAAAYMALGVVFLLLAVYGYRVARGHGGSGLGLLTSYIVLRTLFLLTVPTAEPRYTIECWPMVLVLASLGIAGLRGKGPPRNVEKR
ncbi:MAG: glycosyltransferase family 39 protein [Acidobacteriaceae bacterium]